MSTPDNYSAAGREITAGDIQQMIKRFRHCQRYVNAMEPGQDKSDLQQTIDLAADFIMEIAGEHGFNTIEEISALEDGTITAHIMKFPKEGQDAGAGGAR